MATRCFRTAIAGLWVVVVHAFVGVASEPPISFVNDIQPILTRAGCNQGACHGTQHGKGGFKLSLRAFDDRADQFEIVKGAEGRRVILSDPSLSLLVTKPTLEVPHKGGKRLDKDSWAYETLVRWIEQGAPGPQPKDRQLKSLSVTPPETIMKPGDEILVEVTATYDDGFVEQVGHKASFDTLNNSVAQVTPDGLVTASGKGETAIMVRYLSQVVVSRIVIPYAPPTHLDDWAPYTAIDRIWIEKWKKLGLVPAADCSDAEFLRRIHLDTLGTLPDPQAVQAFLADKSPDKRQKAVDAVLQRPEYVDYWAYKWGDLLRNNRNQLEEKGMWSFHNWLRSCFRDNVRMDAFARQLITAVGSPYQNGPANFYRVANNPNEWAENTAQVLLGVRIQCAQCHHHPFESISQQDYYSMAAFFARLGRKNSQEFGLFGRDSVIFIRDAGEARHPRTGEVMKPTPLGGTAVDDPLDRRRALADWLTDPNNLGLARNLANRYWGYYMGRGIVDPIDDIRASNPASCPEVLDSLARELIEHHYDIKHLLKTIMCSHVYQTSSTPHPASTIDADNRFCTRYTIKRMSAEQLLDALDFACETREKFAQLPAGYRAIALPDTNVNSRFLDIFGRPKREITCECERADTPNMSQALQFMTGALLNRKVADSQGRVARLLREKKPIESAVLELYLCTLSRPPSASEVERGRALVRSAASAKEGLEDLLWTLLNTREFQFVH